MGWDVLLYPFDYLSIPFGDWVQSALDYLVIQFRSFLILVQHPVQVMLVAFEQGLRSVHPLLFISAAFILVWQGAGLSVSIMVLAALIGLGLIGAWQAAMTTFSIVLAALCLCTIIGLPLGILASKSDRLDRILHPILDFMQTTPSFVYLVPVVMFFGIGNAPGVIVTTIFGVSPLIRLTNLGIRQVRSDLVEAAAAFGSTPLQILLKVELPLANRTILAGLNQTVMMSLSMTVIASMISVAGLGRMVLAGIGRLEVGIAAVGGLGIVLLAIIVDRTIQGIARDSRQRKSWDLKPSDLIMHLVGRMKDRPGPDLKEG
ncbi:MAG: ABC transporter permease subunit [Thermodesulfobacteriota bacterium]